MNFVDLTVNQCYNALNVSTMLHFKICVTNYVNHMTNDFSTVIIQYIRYKAFKLLMFRTGNIYLLGNRTTHYYQLIKDNYSRKPFTAESQWISFFDNILPISNRCLLICF